MLYQVNEHEHLPDTTSEYQLPSDVLARLEALPPRERAIAHAMALWACGWSCKRAAEELGVPVSTLWDRIKASEEAGTQRREVHEIIEPLATSIALEAGRQTLEELHDGTSKMPAPVVFGIATDKLHRLHQMKAPPEAEKDATPLSQLFDLLERGGRLELQGPPDHGDKRREASIEGRVIEEDDG
jgi:hypothetical protein